MKRNTAHLQTNPVLKNRMMTAVLVPKWEAKMTRGDGNCFFHALGEPDGDTNELDGVLGNKRLLLS